MKPIDSIDPSSDAALLRHLLGEGSAAERAAIERRLVEEPELARELAATRRVWQGLELPPAAAAPPGFATRVTAQALAGAKPEPLGPRMRLASVAALVAGIALGSLLSLGIGGAAAEGELETTLAESYLDAVAGRIAADESDEPGVPADGSDSDPFEGDGSLR